MKHSIHSMQSPIKLSVIAMVSATLMACGGGGGSASSGGTAIDSHTASDATTNTSTSPTNPTVDLGNNSVTPPVIPKSFVDHQSALRVKNELNLRREKCGINALLPKAEIKSAVDNHGLYINHLLANLPTQVLRPHFNPHVETAILGVEKFSGTNNPYFKGRSDLDRVRAAGYAVSEGNITENIALSSRDNNLGIQVANEQIALSMLNGLLAAPYHQRSLMDGRLKYGDASFSTYVPFGKQGKTSRGYILNTIATTDGRIDLPRGLVTYPCEGTTGTSTALYHESPNPFAGGQRDLRINPIGQPIWINHPTANNIVVTNVKFFDTQRNISLKTHELTKDNDPNKRLRANEMFIIPLTDDIARNSCDANELKLLGDSFKANSCGLYPNTKYQVSFDISVDGKPKTSHSFTFSTGKTSYSS